MASNTLQGSQSPTISVQPKQLMIIRLCCVGSERLLQTKFHVDVRVADVRVITESIERRTSTLTGLVTDVGTGTRFGVGTGNG